MAKAFVSSTYFDLREFRDKVRNVLRRMGHDDMAMEYYVADEQRPVDRPLVDVASCDLFIGILAWQYGWIPPENNPHRLSVTELEYRRALEDGKPCLMFLLDEAASWPLNRIDKDRSRITQFRLDVSANFFVGFYTTPDDLALSLTQAIHNLFLSQPDQEADIPDKESQSPERGSERLGLPSPPDDLISSLAKGECVLYSGAGLSANLGLPTWSLFISGLLKWARDEGYIEVGLAEALKEAIEYGDIDVVADSLINSIGSDLDVVNTYLRKVFLPPSLDLSDQYDLLRNIPFCAALSANFDNLLERNFEQKVEKRIYTPKDTDSLLAALSRNDFFILKLYGTLDRPESVVVAPAQYQALIAENLIFSQYMDSLFVSRTLLFLGNSLNGIAAYLNGLKFQGTSTPRRHYALVDVTGSAWKVKADLLQRRYGISVLPYSASAGYPEINLFLEDIIDKLAVQERDAVASKTITDKTPKTGAWLARLRLENVGPFEDQTFEFNRRWNVLFGDNGVGKSSVLKAIAVALCGQDARPHAEQLIKADRPSSTITLDVASEVSGVIEERRYITKLHRTRTGADVESIPTRALEVENLLSIGFPPLRAMSDGRGSDSRMEEKAGPDPGDLLPLISGAPDIRLDKLKNWILDLENRRNASTDEVERASLSAALVEFFEVIRELTPGVELQLESIDIARKKVMVKTQDGVIPIDYVSQGTTSLIGWIGVLWRRLLDMGGKQQSARATHALVLIDEIDAHMHPKWQQTLPVDIRRLFPSLQVFATTHSPLIVPSLEPGEVFSLTRSPDHNKIDVEKINEDFKGYRADQILTSRLFRLLTSRDKRTHDELMEYTQLAVETSLDKTRQKRLEELTKKLKVRQPLPWEREEARQTYELIKDALTEKIEEMDFDDRGRILDEVKAQLLELDPDAGRLS
jgi:predicted ATP-binding protein involved in virulence